MPEQPRYTVEEAHTENRPVRYIVKTPDPSSDAGIFDTLEDAQAEADKLNVAAETGQDEPKGQETD